MTIPIPRPSKTSTDRDLDLLSHGNRRERDRLKQWAQDRRNALAARRRAILSGQFTEAHYEAELRSLDAQIDAFIAAKGLSARTEGQTRRIYNPESRPPEGFDPGEFIKDDDDDLPLAA